ncbi:DUF397 domain-containing protein [Actinomadura kijaniata]|uniref:DUF397 domain-containing protein n=1 Tax=Actinomadura kijaniata TaxID=46161 RepID=UPI003F1CE4D7
MNGVRRKSSRSNDTGGECVEPADLGEVVGLRDSKAPDVGQLRVGRASLRVLVARIMAWS